MGSISPNFRPLYRNTIIMVKNDTCMAWFICSIIEEHSKIKHLKPFRTDCFIHLSRFISLSFSYSKIYKPELNSKAPMTVTVERWEYPEGDPIPIWTVPGHGRKSHHFLASSFLLRAQQPSRGTSFHNIFPPFHQVRSRSKLSDCLYQKRAGLSPNGFSLNIKR